MKTSKDMFEFGDTRMICANKGAGVRFMGRLGELKVMGNLCGYKG